MGEGGEGEEFLSFTSLPFSLPFSPFSPETPDTQAIIYHIAIVKYLSQDLAECPWGGANFHYLMIDSMYKTLKYFLQKLISIIKKSHQIKCYGQCSNFQSKQRMNKQI